MDKKEKIFELRKNFIDKIYSWDSRIVWGFMLFFGVVLITYISKDNFAFSKDGVNLLLLIIAFLFILVCFEFFIHKLFYRLNKELIEDTNDDSLSNFEKLSFRKYIELPFKN